MREWAERRVEVRAATVATLHFVKPRAAERRHMGGMLSLVLSEDVGAAWAGRLLERWQYLGTFFHPHLEAWVHDLRYCDQEGGPLVALRVPVSERHQPAVGPDVRCWVEARVRDRFGARGPPCLELVISTAPDRAFA